MNLFVHNVNPIPIVKIDLEPHECLTVDEVNIMKELDLYDKFNMGLSVSYKLVEEFKLDRIGKVFDRYVDYYVKNVLGLNNKFSRTQSWLTVHDKGSEHHNHFHPNSMIAAVLYFNETMTSDPMAPLIVTIPGTDNTFPSFKFLMDIHENNLYNYTEYTLYPITNRMFIFPAHLMHKTLPEQGNIKRYAIGTNYFINDNIHLYSVLENIKVSVSAN